MGTRSRIAVMHGNIVKSVYCHWDGYLEYNGVILQQHYDSPKANNLVALGDLSSLGSKIGEKHPFSQFAIDKNASDYAEQLALYDKSESEDWCTFYGRDRGEENTEWKVAHTFEEFLEQVDVCGAEYYYIMRDGVWFCGTVHADTEMTNVLTTLTEALKETA